MTFTVPGIPPSVANQIVHPMKRYRLGQEWRGLVAAYANNERNRARYPKAREGEKRQVIITVYRCHLLDKDNAYAAVKPWLDALKAFHMRQVTKGVMIPVEGVGLIYNDDERHVDLHVRQERVQHLGEQRTEVQIASKL